MQYEDFDYKEERNMSLVERFQRVGSKIRYFLPAIICIALSIFLVSRNYYKGAFQSETPVSLQEAEEGYDYKVGYPAGEDIPIAKSVEDMMKYRYFTIEVTAEDIRSTRKFQIKNIQEAGEFQSTSYARGVSGTYKIPSFYSIGTSAVGDFFYQLRQIGWNMDGVSYGECCVITLESGERVFAFLDPQLLELSDDKKIKLPIGTRESMKLSPWENLDYKTYQVDKENRLWLINMVGDREDTEVGNRPTLLVYIICFVAILVSISWGIVSCQKNSRKKNDTSPN